MDSLILLKTKIELFLEKSTKLKVSCISIDSQDLPMWTSWRAKYNTKSTYLKNIFSIFFSGNTNSDIFFTRKFNIFSSQKTIIRRNGINKHGSKYSVKEIKVASLDFLILFKNSFFNVLNIFWQTKINILEDFFDILQNFIWFCIIGQGAKIWKQVIQYHKHEF